LHCNATAEPNAHLKSVDLIGLDSI